MEKLSLVGEKYKLFVQAEHSHYSWNGGNSEVGDSFCSRTCWKGTGRLMAPDGELVFEFKTREYREISCSKLPSLEAEFIVVHGISPDATVVDKEKIIDTFCGALETAIRTEKAKGENLFAIAVTIVLPVLEGKPLLNQGLMLEPGYQMELLQ